MKIEAVLAFDAVADERAKQNEKWGVQRHGPFTWLAILTEEVGELAEAALHDEFGGEHADTLKEELTHVAAVAVQWLEQLEWEELDLMQALTEGGTNE